MKINSFTINENNKPTLMVGMESGEVLSLEFDSYEKMGDYIEENGLYR